MYWGKWVIQSRVFVCGRHSRVWAALSALIAPRDMPSLINRESTDPRHRRRRNGIGELMRGKGKQRRRKKKPIVLPNMPFLYLREEGEVMENTVTRLKRRKKSERLYQQVHNNTSKKTKIGPPLQKFRSLQPFECRLNG